MSNAQSRSPSSPTTEAGPEFGRAFGRIMQKHPKADARFVNDVLRLAWEAARTDGDTEGYIRGVANGVKQGRREAVREARAEIAANRKQGVTWEPLVPAKIDRWYAEGYDRGLRDADSILDEIDGVAGLNASETPPTGVNTPASDRRELIDTAWPQLRDVRRDASESPPRVSILDSDPAEGEGMDDWVGETPSLHESSLPENPPQKFLAESSNDESQNRLCPTCEGWGAYCDEHKPT